MSVDDRPDGRRAGDHRDPDDPDLVELVAERDLLAEENRRLREEYTRARHAQYRRTAAGLVLVGAVAGVAGLVFPDSRAVLFALCATGVFGGTLTYYLTPERFVAAEVGGTAYDAFAANVEAIVDELGLSGDQVYVPREDATGDPVRLFLPARADHELPAPGALDAVFVVPEDDGHRGVSLRPTGASLFEEFERVLAGPLAGEPETLAGQLADGLVEQFELAARATPDVDPGGGRATVGIGGSAYGGLGRIDHPIVSFLAIGFATGLGRPVRVETANGEDRGYESLVTIRWSTDEQTA